ncbi:MAG: TonB-dependent receptor, partial [Acidobacteriota bacterium]
MRNRKVRIICLAAAALVLAIGLMAQQGGGMQGKVTDEAGQPVIGATIQVSGPNLQGFMGTASDTNGQYVIPFLPVGKDYQVKVEAPGYNTVVRKGIEIPLGTTISLPFTLSQGKTEIVVTAAAPVIDTKRTEVGANISDTMISSIPLARNSAGIAFLAPGAVSSGLADTPSIGGASGPENSYTVNGVDVTGSGDALNLTALNFDFIEATEVKTGGLDAEFGALMGGNINSITKSGGNEFHGSLFAYYFDDGMGATERRLVNPTIVNFRKAFKQYDIGGSLGGYFIKDKLWFFVAYDYNKTEQSFTANGGDDNVYLNGRPSYSWAAATGYENTDKDPQYALKLTWNVSPNHKLGFSWFGNNDTVNRFRNLGNLSPVASPTEDKTDNYALSLQWNATWTPKFFTEMVIARRHTKDQTVATNAQAMDSWGYYYRYGSGTYVGYQAIPDPTVLPNSYHPATSRIDLAAYSPSYGGMTYQYTTDINDQLRFKATHLFNFHGRHELSYGFQYYDIQYDYDFNYTGPGVTSAHTLLYDPSTGLYINNPWLGRTSNSGAIVRWHYVPGSSAPFRYRAQTFMNNQAKETKQKYYAYWAQNNWNITDYFMLKVGVRLDQIHMKGGDNSINVPAVLAPAGGVRGQFSDGKARKVNINDMWAPRIGFTWDVFHNSKSKLYGFWGQYYERIPNDMAIRALTDEYFFFEYFRDPALTTPVSIAWSYGLYPTQITGGPNGGSLKGSYNNETILGFQYEVRPDFSVGARAIYRTLGRA